MNIQFNHVQELKTIAEILHPSDGKTATHISWVVNQIEKIKLIQLRPTVNFVY
jgi:hypothetical protein